MALNSGADDYYRAIRTAAAGDKFNIVRVILEYMIDHNIGINYDNLGSLSPYQARIIRILLEILREKDLQPDYQRLVYLMIFKMTREEVLALLNDFPINQLAADLIDFYEVIIGIISYMVNPIEKLELIREIMIKLNRNFDYNEVLLSAGMVGNERVIRYALEHGANNDQETIDNSLFPDVVATIINEFR